MAGGAHPDHCGPRQGLCSRAPTARSTLRARLSGFREGACRPPTFRPVRGAARSGRRGLGVGGAEPRRGFLELLQPLGLQSGAGLGLCPSELLILAPPNLRAAFQIWFSVSTWSWEPGHQVQSWFQFPTFASSGSVLGSVISLGPRGVVSSVPGLGDASVDADDLLQSFSSRPA